MAKSPYPWLSYSQPKIGRYRPGVLPSSMTTTQQRVLWEGIKALAPDLAKLIKTDAGFAELKTAFSGELSIDLADFNRYIEAGQKIIEEKNRAKTA